MANFFEGGVGFNADVPSSTPPKTGVDPTQVAAGGAAGGPWGMMIAAALALVQNAKAKKAAAAAAKEEERRFHRDQIPAAQAQQQGAAKEIGDKQMSAIQQMLGVLARSQR